MCKLKELIRGVLLHDSPAIDFVGYEVLLKFIKKTNLHKLPGDFIEIGAFTGGGTVKLARLARKYHKKVYVIDIFNPRADKTATADGTTMSDIYLAFLEGQSQLDMYQKATRSFNNIVTIIEDSKNVRFPGAQQFVFGFIDGNHHPDYVINDFHVIWHNLVPGGVLGLHDYDFELPDVTATINRLVQEYGNEISEIFHIKDRHIILLKKSGA